MSKSAGKRKEARREALVGLALVISLVAVMGFGGVFLFRDVPAHLGYDMQHVLSGWQVLGFSAVAMLAIGVLVYISIVCWLVFAKLFFTRAEVLKVVCYGPTTRFDRWLIDQFFPEG